MTHQPWITLIRFKGPSELPYALLPKEICNSTSVPLHSIFTYAKWMYKLSNQFRPLGVQFLHITIPDINCDLLSYQFIKNHIVQNQNFKTCHQFNPYTLLRHSVRPIIITMSQWTSFRLSSFLKLFSLLNSTVSFNHKVKQLLSLLQLLQKSIAYDFQVSFNCSIFH